MKARRIVSSAALVAGAVFLLCSASPAGAANQYFDLNGATAGDGLVTGGSYLWSNTNGGWTASTAGTLATLNYSTSNVAFFNGITGGTATSYTMTLDASLASPLSGFGINVGSSGTAAIVTINGTQNFHLNGTSTWTVNSGSTLVDNNMNGNGAINLNNHNLILAGAGNMTFSGSGLDHATSSVTDNLTGTLSLQSAAQSSFNSTSAFSLNSGTLLLAANGALGTANLTIAGGTLDNTTGAAMTVGGTGNAFSGNFTFLGSNPLTVTGAVTLTNSPTITVNANTLTVNGAIGGTGQLGLAGAGMLALGGASNYSGNTTIGGGTLQLIGTGVLGGGNYSAAIANSGTLLLNTSSPQTLGGVISGNGSLYQNGAGGTTLTAGNTYSGNTNIGAGTLFLSGTASIASSPAINITPGAVLDVSGLNSTFTLGASQSLTAGRSGGPATDINGSLTSGGTINDVGSLTAPNTLTINGSLTLTGGYITPNLGTPLSAAADLINLGGGAALTLAGTTTLQPYYLANGTYTIINGYSSLAGTGTMVLGPSLLGAFRGSPSESLSVGGSAVTVTISGLAAPANLTWTGNGGNNNWDVATTQNWNNSGSADYFYQADNVTFDDSASTTTVNIPANVFPNSVTVSTSGRYTLGGSGAIGGPTTLTKNGTGTLAMTSANTYFGGTIINGGTLSLGNNISGNESPLALGSGTVSVQNNAWLVLAAGDTRTYSIPYAITLSGGGIGQSSGNQVLTGPLTIGSGGGSLVASGTGLTVAGGISGSAPLGLGGGGSLGNLYITSSNSYSGTATVNSNVVVFVNNANAFANATVNLSGGASSTLDFGQNTANFGSLTGSGSLSLLSTAGAAVTLTVGSNNSNFATYSGVLSGSGGLTMTGNGMQTLGGGNIYKGGTSVSVGTLEFNGPGNTLPGTVLVGTSSTASGSPGTLLFDGNSVASFTATADGAFTVNWGSTLLIQPNALVTVASDLKLGSQGAVSSGNVVQTGGTLNVNGVNTANQNRALVIGEFPNESSSYTLSGGLLNVPNGSTFVPYHGNLGSLNISTGTANLQGFVVGQGTGAVTGDLNLSGGALYLGTGGMTLGNSADTANVSLSGGTLGAYAAPGWSSSLAISLSNTATINPQGNTINLSGQLSGGGALSLAGGGVLALSNTSNFYGGGTTISAGTLNINNDGSLGSSDLTFAGSSTLQQASTASVSLVNGRNLFINNGVTATIDTQNNAMFISDLINGSGGLTKVGTGALTLSNVNLYSGPTNINAGSLVVSGALLATGSVNIAGGATLSGSGSVGLTTVASGGTIDVSQNGSNTFGLASLSFTSGAAINVGQFANNLSPTGVLALNAGAVNAGTTNGATFTFPGGSVPDGNIRLLGFSSLGGVGSTGFTFARPSGLSGRQFASLVDTGSEIDLNVTGDFPLWTGANGTAWVGQNNWLLYYAGTPTDFLPGDAVQFADAAVTASGAVTPVTNTTVIISGGNVVPTSVIFNNNTLSYTISGDFGIAGSASTLFVNGAGTVTIATSNSYGGGTFLNAGLLNIGNSAALGSGPLTISGGSIDNTAGQAITLANNIAQNWDNSFTFLGSNDLNLGTGAVTLSGSPTITVVAGTLTVGGGIGGTSQLNLAGAGTFVMGGSNSYSGDTTINNAALVYDFPGPQTYSGAISGSGSLSNIAAGLLNLSGSNTYGGGTALTQGTLQAGNASAFGTGGMLVNGGVLQLNGNNISVANLSGSGGQVGNFSPSTAATLTIGSDGTSTGYGGNVVNGGSGTLSLVKIGAGSLSLAGSCSYTGSTTIDNGTLMYGNNFLSGGSLTFGAAVGNTTAGTLDLSTASLTATSLGLVNAVTTNAVLIGPGQRLQISGNSTLGAAALNANTGLILVGSGAFGISGGTFDLGPGNTAGNNVTATLDASGLATFTANVANFDLGVDIIGGGRGNAGVLYLAASSTITANIVDIQDGRGSNSGPTCHLYLSSGTNTINANTILVATSKEGTGTLQFGSGTTGVVTISGTSGGTSRVTNFYDGYKSNASGGNPTATVDFSGGGVTAWISTLYIALTGAGVESVTNPSSPKGTFTMGTNPNSLVDANTVEMSAGTGSTATATLNVLGGTLRFGSFTTPVGTAVVNFEGGTIASQVGVIAPTAMNLNFNLGQAAAGSSTISFGQAVGGTGPLSFGGAVTLQDNVVVNAVQNTTFSGAIGDGNIGYSITEIGSALLTLAGANTYLGSTTITSGTLQVGDGGIGASIGNTSSVLDNSSLIFNHGDTIAFAAPISGTGTLTHTGTGLLTLSASNGYSGGTTVSGGTLQLGNTSALGTGGLTANSGVVDLAGFSPTVTTFNGASGTVTSSAGSAALTVTSGGVFSGTIEDDPNLPAGTAPVALILSGGELTLSGTDTYTGGTSVIDGTLILGTSEAIAAGSSLTVGNASAVGLAIGPLAVSSSAPASAVSLVPEPGTLWLLAVAGFMAAATWRRKR